MLTRAPTRIGATSPRRTQPNQMVVSAPMTVSPTTAAFGAMKASGWMLGTAGPNGMTRFMTAVLRAKRRRGKTARPAAGRNRGQCPDFDGWPLYLPNRRARARPIGAKIRRFRWPGALRRAPPPPIPLPQGEGEFNGGKPPPLAGGGRGRGRTSVSELILTPMGLVPDIHVVQQASGPTWMAGTSPAMTTKRRQPLESQH